MDLLLFLGVRFRVRRDMPGQSGASEIKAGKNWINRGRERRPSQAVKLAAEAARRVGMSGAPAELGSAAWPRRHDACRGGGTGNRAKRLFRRDRKRREQ